MRIAIVGSYQEVVGGVETYLTWILSALVRRGHQVAFAFERPSTVPERAVDRGIAPLVRWDMTTMSRTAFLDRLAEFQPEVVFLQGCQDETTDLALTERFRVVLFAHVFYGACATGWRVHQFPHRQICTRRFGPACLPTNFLRGCGAKNPVRLLKLYASQSDRSRVLRGIAALVVASEYMRQVFLQHGVAKEHVHVLPPPTDLSPDLSPPAPSKALDRVLFLGRLTTAKGSARAVQAVARCQRALGRPLHLTLAGEGRELELCRALARRLGVHTEFAGWVGAERRLELLREADVLIVPSLWPEPFGMVGVEAGSVGLPAVAYNAGGIVDWLRPGESGELAVTQRFDVRALADALHRALRDRDHHRRLQLGAWRMSQEFGGERHILGIESVFKEVLSRRDLTPLSSAAEPAVRE